MPEISAESVEGSKGFPKDVDLKLRGRILVVMSKRDAHQFTPE